MYVFIIISILTFSERNLSANTIKDKEFINRLRQYNDEEIKRNPTTIRYAFNAHMQPYGIIIDGEIKSGDYDKFQELVKNGNGDIGTVWLRSPGGDAIEAMKIGRLIRTLKMATSAPIGTSNKSYCMLHKPVNTKNCTCASSCFLVFVAGIYRDGEVLGIHRIYQNHQQLKQMTSEVAAESAIKIKKLVGEYLKEMGVPSAFLDRIMAISSKEIEFLELNEIKKYFNDFLPEVQEWMLANCGDLFGINIEQNNEFKKFGASKKWDSLNKIETKILECRLNRQKSEVSSAYKNYFKQK
jgi:hypothetical protein